MKELTTEKLISLLRDNPLTRGLLQEAEQAEELVKERIKASTEIKVLKQEKTEKMPLLLEEVEIKKQTFFETKDLLKQAQEKWNKANSLFMSESYHFESEIQKRESFLRDTAPAELKFKLENLKELQIKHFNKNRDPKKTDISENGKTIKTITNEDEILAERRRIEDEIKAVEQLILNPKLEGDN